MMIYMASFVVRLDIFCQNVLQATQIFKIPTYATIANAYTVEVTKPF